MRDDHVLTMQTTIFSDADGIIGESNIDEQSLSFSSSSAGGDSKFSNLHTDLHLNDTCNLHEGGGLNDATTPVITGESLQHLYSAQHAISNISSSAHTARISNTNTSRDCTSSPPDCIEQEDNEASLKSNRSIFGKQTKKKYHVRRKPESENAPWHDQSQKSPLAMEESIPTPTEPGDQSNGDDDLAPLLNLTKKTLLTPPRTPGTPGTPGAETESNPPPLDNVGFHNFLSPNMSPLTPLGKGPGAHHNGYQQHLLRKMNDADESSVETSKEYAVQFDPTITRYHDESPASRNNKTSTSEISQDHYHSQAFLLSFLFFFVWSPQNLLAPNLTQAAHDFGFGEDTRARDLYLGSNLALATSVLSLPFSAFIGFATDVVPSRRMLISVTALVGGTAAIATGMSTSYPQLILSRFIGGSAMSGSVPVVFSLLSDWFDDKDRNAASSGFTAMMGAGIILGQVYAGCTGPTAGWRHCFFTSGALTISLAVVVMVFVRDPVRGGKEQVLQKMLAHGKKYDRKLTWSQFVSCMRNASNVLLMLQGFFCNLPWGIFFVFLNDFLSQEKGLTVPDATFIVAVFGVGCAVGGILGGFLGSMASRADRRYLPLFMAASTIVGVAPFLSLLDDPSYDHAGFLPCFYAFAGGCLSSMPSVNIRPCIINVNPPEIRGAVLTSANLIINAARGVGPSFLTTILMGTFQLSRASGFNIMIIVFWTIAALQLAALAKTLPLDQERMETELANYAETSMSMDVGYGSLSVDEDTRGGVESYYDDTTLDGDRSLFSIENQASAFDGAAARQSLQFIGDALSEIGDGISFCSQAKCYGRK